MLTGIISLILLIGSSPACLAKGVAGEPSAARNGSISTIAAMGKGRAAHSATLLRTVESSSPAIVLAGSTPGDTAVLSMLTIGQEKPIDFIRWDLTIAPIRRDAGTFALAMVFGEGEPNTPGFKHGGQRRTISGGYVVARNRYSDIYSFTGKDASGRFSLVKLNADLFHLLSPTNELMVGNGGWSYTLTRRGAAGPTAGEPPFWTTSQMSDVAETVFDGRTPCQEFAAEYKMAAGPDCHKLKWKLTLYRDNTTKQPTAYKLQHTLINHKVVEGKWAISNNSNNGSKAIIYRLDPDKPGRSISFLAGDENVLFFLDRESRLMPGNEHFGYTLNRRINK
ncbi:hypothetical protein BH20ACI2_BH20ACI2_23360 [soil metagenome]